MLRSGLANIRTYTADGDEMIISSLGVDVVFGEMVAVDSASRSAD